MMDEHYRRDLVAHMATFPAPRDWQRDVREFNRAIRTPMRDKPGMIPAEEAALATRLIQEEIGELNAALSLPDVADAIVDSIYVLLGLACRLGIEVAPLWAEVHAANMAKVGGPKRADGKALKPDGWQPPRIGELLERQGWEP